MFQLILCNCPDKQSAEQIAKELVTQGLVACVNIMPEVTSIYMWENTLQCEPEVTLLCKTKAERFSELAERITQLHPYDVPEVIALDIKQGNSAYLDWLNSMVK